MKTVTAMQTHGYSDVQCRILDAYIYLCHKIGPTEVTLQKVADRANVAFNSVRYHYADPEKNLLRSATQYVFQMGQQYVQNHVDAKRAEKSFNAIHEYIRANFKFQAEHVEHFSYVCHFYYMRTTQLNLGIDNKQFLQTANARVQSLLHESIGRGIYKPIKNSFEVAAQIHMLLVGGLLMSLSQRDKKIMAAQQELIIRGADSLIEFAF